MKKFKLMLVAIMAMFGVNAFGQAITGTSQTIGGLKYKVLSVYKTQTETNINTVSVTANNFAGATLTIGDVIKFDVEGIDDDGAEYVAANVEFKIVKIEASAFAGNTTITSASIGKNVNEIEASAFEGCAKLASVTFAEGSALATLGNYVFATTPSLTSIDFTNCSKLLTIATTPFIPNAAKNNELTTIKFNTTITNIGTALKDIAKLSSVNLGDTKITALADNSLSGTSIAELVLPATCTQVGATGANKLTSLEYKATTWNFTTAPAFTMAADADATVKFGNLETLTAAPAGTIVAPTSDGKKLTVTIGDIKAVPGTNAFFTKADKVTTGAISKAVDLRFFAGVSNLVFGDIATGGSIASGKTAASTDILSVTFNGTIVAGGVAAKAFVYESKLATATFNKKIAAGGVAAGSFGDGANYAGSALYNATTNPLPLTVTYSPEEADEVANAFAEDAFDDGTIDTPAKGTVVRVKFATTTHYAGVIAPALYLVEISAAAPETTIELANNGTGSFYYAKFYNAGACKIAKENEDGDKVIVYGAYVDASDATIYMEQLHIIDGFYHIPATTPVIVKSTSNKSITAVGDTSGDNSMNYTSVGPAVSTINYLGAQTLGTTLMNNALYAGQNLYALAKISKYNITWKKFGASTTLPEGTFFVAVPADKDAARLNVVWLDGSEEGDATAIKTVKAAAEKGAIYNLAGQKVNAAYKGVVIKDGKKYIQK